MSCLTIRSDGVDQTMPRGNPVCTVYIEHIRSTLIRMVGNFLLDYENHVSTLLHSTPVLSFVSLRLQTRHISLSSIRDKITRHLQLFASPFTVEPIARFLLAFALELSPIWQYYFPASCYYPCDCISALPDMLCYPSLLLHKHIALLPR